MYERIFEDALVESSGRLNRKSSGWTLLSLGFYSAIFAAMILVPLLNPEVLPQKLYRDILIVPPPSAPVALPTVAVSHPAGSFSSGRAIQLILNPAIAAHIPIPSLIGDGNVPSNRDGIPGLDFGSGSGTPFGDPSAMSSKPPAPRVTAPSKPIRLSTGIMSGYALYHPDPPYPAIARATRTSGVVVLDVTISKGGTIEGVRLVSGSPMLIPGARETVKSWRYRPYLLNGEPVEVQMQVTVRFVLDG